MILIKIPDHHYDKRVLSVRKSYNSAEKNIEIEVGDVPAKKVFNKIAASLSRKNDDVKEIALETAKVKKAVDSSVNGHEVYFSADEPGANAVSGDFWAVQPTTTTVSALFKYNGSAWSVASPFICSGQPPEDPKKDQYWCYISNNELTAIYQYVDEEWVNVSSGKTIYKSDKSPPGDNDVWIEIDNDTDLNIKAVHSMLTGSYLVSPLRKTGMQANIFSLCLASKMPLRWTDLSMASCITGASTPAQ